MGASSGTCAHNKQFRDIVNHIRMKPSRNKTLYVAQASGSKGCTGQQSKRTRVVYRMIRESSLAILHDSGVDLLRCVSMLTVYSVLDHAQRPLHSTSHSPPCIYSGAVLDGTSANRTDHVLSYRETLAKTGCESCLLYTSPSPRDLSTSRMPSSA